MKPPSSPELPHSKTWTSNLKPRWSRAQPTLFFCSIPLKNKTKQTKTLKQHLDKCQSYSELLVRSSWKTKQKTPKSTKQNTRTNPRHMPKREKTWLGSAGTFASSPSPRGPRQWPSPAPSSPPHRGRRRRRGRRSAKPRAPASRVQPGGACFLPKKSAWSLQRDPHVIHLNIALSMVVSLYFGGKSHVSNGQNVYFKEPCSMTLKKCLVITQNNGWSLTLVCLGSEGDSR